MTIGDGGQRIVSRALREQATGEIAFMARISQSAGGNGRHRLEPRCCGWPLTSRDRIGSDDFRLMHQGTANRLGARKASVLGPLQEAGWFARTVASSASFGKSEAETHEAGAILGRPSRSDGHRACRPPRIRRPPLGHGEALRVQCLFREPGEVPDHEVNPPLGNPGHRFG